MRTLNDIIKLKPGEQIAGHTCVYATVNSAKPGYTSPATVEVIVCDFKVGTERVVICDLVPRKRGRIIRSGRISKEK